MFLDNFRLTANRLAAFVIRSGFLSFFKQMISSNLRTFKFQTQYTYIYFNKSKTKPSGIKFNLKFKII